MPDGFLGDLDLTADGAPERGGADPIVEDSLLVEVLDGYLNALKEGQVPDRDELITRYPHLKHQLEACLAGLEFIHRAGSPAGAAPQRLGDFRLIREVGRGGMGAVFEAEQLSLHRRVAVKVLRFGPVSDPKALDRFRREAETVAHLHHTNIVPIFFVGAEAGVNYYAMEFVDGRSLAQVLAERGGPVDPRTVVDWGLQAAEALSHAHQRGVIHRDVKPSNLLLDGEGRIWLTDFGLAKRLDDVTLSLTGALLGTPRYMSPEQASSTRHQLDHRTDLYSLGATLFELTTGRPVVSAETPHQAIDQILNEEPPPPRQLSPGLPRDVETVLLKCLAKEPDRRYPSARSLADDLRAVLDGRPIAARRTGPLERCVKWLRRHRRSLTSAVASAACAAVLVLVAVFALAVYGRRQMAHVWLATNQPPLAVEILAGDGRLVTRQTAPTQEAVDVPAGDYRIKVSGQRRLSESYDARFERGQSPKLDLHLDGSLLTPPMDLDGSFRILTAGGRTLVATMDDQGLRCWDMQRAGLQWTMSLRPGEQPMLDGTGWVWPWNSLLSSPYRGWHTFDLRPFIVDPAIDVNADGAGDLILASRHQACLLAVSGADGKLLWYAGLGDDLDAPVGNEAARWQQGVVSGIAAPPVLCGDVDSDGVEDLIALIAQRREPDSAERWIEAISGRTGQTLWRRGLEDRLFEEPAELDVPEPFRWFYGSSATYSHVGSQELVNCEVLMREPPRLERTGFFHRVPSQPVLASWHKGRTQPPHLTFVVGSQICAFDVRTGEPMGSPFDCGFAPGAEPLLADVDGDGADDLVMIQETARNGVSGPNTEVRLGVASLVERRMLWSKPLLAQWPRPAWPALPVAPPRWPVAADLDGDGSAELIVPNGSSRFATSRCEAWGELEVLDGATGRSRWKRRLKTMDQQLDHLLAGPDVDGDGVREVFAVSLWSLDFDLYVDALSGRDGSRLWIGRNRLRRITDSVRYQLTPPLWWQAGRDGWPQLVVPLVVTEGTLKDPLVCIFSAGTGEVTQTGSKFIEFQATDADGDGIHDLFAFEPVEETSLEAGGTLVCFRGQARQLWRSIGRRWFATADLDVDGTRDLIRTGTASDIIAASGSDGRLLWSTRLPVENVHRLNILSAAPRSDGALGADCLTDDLLAHAILQNPGKAVQRPAGDFDGDGVIDLLAYVSNVGLGEPFSPLYAVSGKTGRRLWSAHITGTHFAGALALDTRDLDGDGRAEILWAGASDWDFPDSREFSIHQKQMVLAVLSASDGRVVWKHLLSKRYGLTPQTNTSAWDFENGWLALSYADLNGDRALDILLAAEAEEESETELRAISGRTGDVLWRHSLPPGLDDLRPFSDVPPATLTDLDGDGRLEAVVFSVSRSPQTGRANAMVETLEGIDGRQRWSAQWDVPNSCGRLMGDVQKRRYQPRPLPLRAADGTSRICINLWDSPERIVVLDSLGQTVSDFRLETLRGFHRGQFRVWPCDADADGSDEILLTNRDHLMAIPPDRPDQPLWQRPVHHLWSEEIEGVLPADEQHGQLAVIRHVDSPGTVYALDTSAGRTVWTTPSPSPRREGHYIIIEHGQTAILRDAQASQPPRLFFQHALVSSVHEASPAMAAMRDHVHASEAERATRVPAGLLMEINDPRLQRPLPWAPAARELALFPTVLAWAFFFTVAIFYVPGIYLLHSFARRRWSLRWFLLSPAVVALPLIAALVDMPEWSDDFLTARVALGAIALPALLALVQLVRWSVRRRWRPVVAWLVTAALSSLALAAIGLALAPSVARVPLQPDDYYGWDGWWFILLHGAYVAACLQTLLLFGIAGIKALIRTTRRWRRVKGAT